MPGERCVPGLGLGEGASRFGVLSCVFEGLANKEIAPKIGVSEGSVKFTLQQLSSKTEVRRRSQWLRIVLELSRSDLAEECASLFCGVVNRRQAIILLLATRRYSSGKKRGGRPIPPVV
jgi:hypothetical protein